jgi:hypothetical protein
MSLKTTIEIDFKKIEKEAVTLFRSTTWEQKVSSAVSIAAPFVEELAQLAAGTPAEQLVAGAVSVVQSDLLTVKTVVSGATSPTGTSGIAAISTALASIQTNLAPILASADVKNSKNAAAITNAATLLLTSAQAILASVPTPTVAVAAPVAVPVVASK